jgi:hypothetical protein
VTLAVGVRRAVVSWPSAAASARAAKCAARAKHWCRARPLPCPPCSCGGLCAGVRPGALPRAQALALAVQRLRQGAAQRSW